MEKNINYLLNLVNLKKQEELSAEDQIKLKEAESLLKIEGLFFKIDIDTAIGLLDFIGVPRNDIKDIYRNMTSIEAYTSTKNKQYTLVSEEEIIKNHK